MMSNNCVRQYHDPHRRSPCSAFQEHRRSMSHFEDHIDLTKAIPMAHRIRSYLQINFDTDFIDTLHGVLCDFKVQFESVSRPKEFVRHNNDWGQIVPLDIQPYAKEDMQSVVLFDADDTLFEMPPELLIKYHRGLTRRLNKCGFLSDSNYISNTSSTNYSSDDSAFPPGRPTPHWYIRVKELKLAPRDKLNTIVAVLQPSPFWRRLHKEIQNLANRTPGMIRTRHTEELWEPTVTIAHVYCGMAGRTKYETLLRDLLPIMPFHRFNVSSKIQSITMGGIIPTLPPIEQERQQQHQRQLNWNFQFHGRPLLELRETTEIQDSHPETFFDLSVDDSDPAVKKQSHLHYIHDEITDDELIDDPLESYVVDLEDIEFETRRPDGTSVPVPHYFDDDAFSELDGDESDSDHLLAVNKVYHSNKDDADEIDTDDILTPKT
jgi:hypothetical protein